MYWPDFLGRDHLSFGQCGENLTVDGLADGEVTIGDRYWIGDVLLDPTPAVGHMPQSGDAPSTPDMPALLVSRGRHGPYI
jgi:hypothetical protein